MIFKWLAGFVLVSGWGLGGKCGVGGEVKMTIMTDQEKIKKFDVIETLRTRIGGCFGDQDKIFATHVLDENRAKELRKLAKENSISLNEVQDIIAGYLYRSGFNAKHVMEQIKKASDFFAKN